MSNIYFTLDTLIEVDTLEPQAVDMLEPVDILDMPLPRLSCIHRVCTGSCGKMEYREEGKVDSVA